VPPKIKCLKPRRNDTKIQRAKQQIPNMRHWIIIIIIIIIRHWVDDGVETPGSNDKQRRTYVVVTADRKIKAVFCERFRSSTLSTGANE